MFLDVLMGWRAAGRKWLMESFNPFFYSHYSNSNKVTKNLQFFFSLFVYFFSGESCIIYCYDFFTIPFFIPREPIYKLHFLNAFSKRIIRILEREKGSKIFYVLKAKGSPERLHVWQAFPFPFNFAFEGLKILQIEVQWQQRSKGSIRALSTSPTYLVCKNFPFLFHSGIIHALVSLLLLILQLFCNFLCSCWVWFCSCEGEGDGNWVPNRC